MTRTRTKSNFGDKVARNVQKQRESKKSFGYLNLPKGVKVLSLEDGLTRVDLDFLPYIVSDEKHPDREPQFEIAVKDSLWYRRPIKVHRNVGTDNETVICLKSVGKKCPICTYHEKKLKEGGDKEELKELYPKPRSLYVVVPLGMKKFEEIPHIWDMSDYLFQDQLNDELEASIDDRNFPDLENGKTATLKIKWKSLGGNSYPEVRSISFNDRDPYDESILDDVPDLDNVLKVLSYEELEAKFLELDNEEDAGGLKDDEDDEKPVRRTSRTAANHVDDNEDDEKPVRRSNRSEPEEEKPVRRSAKREEPEEEPEEEKPTRAASRGRDEEGRRPSKDTDTKNKCPHGHKFGVDTETKKECDTCDVWEKCIDAKEGK